MLIRLSELVEKQADESKLLKLNKTNCSKETDNNQNKNKLNGYEMQSWGHWAAGLRNAHGAQ